MGIVKSSGSLESVENNYIPLSDMEEVENVDKVTVHPTPQQRIDAESYIRNTVESTNAIPDSSALIQAMTEFVSGIPIVVTFYHVINNDTFGRSFTTDFDRELDPVHTSYLKIINFQMRLKSSMQFNYETELTTSHQTGEAVLYPYFCPNTGDIFLYELPNKRVGIFKIIEAPTRLAIHDTTCHEIRFRLVDFVTPALYKKIEASVSETAYFNLKRYLADSGALLTSNETDILNKATQSFNILIHAYNEEFYDRDVYQTFIEDLAQYDPYVVEFLPRIIETDKLSGYPTQLLPNPPNWKRSFWFKLLDPAMVPDSILINKAAKAIYKVNYRTTRVNALSNRNYIEVTPKGGYNYPPFRIPCNYTDDVIGVPMQVALYFNHSQVRPAALLKLANDVLSMRRVSRFYYIPILLFLLKKLILALSSGKDEWVRNTPITEDTQDCQNCPYTCERNGDARTCILSKNADQSICPYIPACGGSATDDDCDTTTPVVSGGTFEDFGLRNRIWRQDFGKMPPKMGTVNIFPTDIFYTREQVDQIAKSINKQIQTPDISTLPDSTNIIKNIQDRTQSLEAELQDKVTKVDGKGLSTNDFTDTYKQKLDDMGEPVTVADASTAVKGIVQLATEAETLAGENSSKAVVPITLKKALDNKVSVVDGKGLSTNDYTNEDKTKVNNALTSVPDATTSIKGVVQLATDAEVGTGTNTTKAVTPSGLKTALDEKVNVEQGKGLSTNDYTTEDKNKVASAITELPTATTTRQGIIEVATGAEVAAGEDATRAVVPKTLKTELDRRKATDFSVINDTKVPSVKAVSDHVTQQLAKHGLDAAISVEELPIDAEEGKIGIVASGGVFVLYEKGETEWAPLEYAGLADVSDALKLIRGEEVEGNPIWLNGKDAYQEWLEQGNTGDINDFFNAIGGLTSDEKAKVATINLETLDVLSGTVVNVLPWKQYKWVADGTCTLIVSGWATSGKQVSELLITLTEGSTLGIIGAEVDEEKDAITEPGVYSCFLKNLEGIVRFKKVDRWEAI